MFNGRVLFEDILFNLETLVTQVAIEVNANVEKLQGSKNIFLTSLERLAIFIEEFDHITAQQVAQKENWQNEALNIVMRFGLKVISFHSFPRKSKPCTNF